MDYNASNEMFETAKEYFELNKYELAEPILNQIILKNTKRPEVFHMLGTIYYDQGKFNKAIRAFKRAIEIDSSFTDASVGLSIILNDLGRYEEGQEIFENAQKLLARKEMSEESGSNEKIATKYDELGELFFNTGEYEEALSQYKKSLKLSKRTAEITMNIIRCYEKLDEYDQALVLLNELCDEYPDFVSARLKLGKLYYDTRQVPEAVEQWEVVLSKDPENKTAKEYLRLANSVEYTSHNHLNL